MAADDKPPKTSSAPNSREARLARALRDNLRRRKAPAPRDAEPLKQKPDPDNGR